VGFISTSIIVRDAPLYRNVDAKELPATMAEALYPISQDWSAKKVMRTIMLKTRKITARIA